MNNYYICNQMEKVPSQVKKVEFQQFLDKFPIVELPITLGENTHHLFSKNNDPFQQGMIDQFLTRGSLDEYTEFIPCCRIPDTSDFYALIYWKAGLLEYEYYMVTFSKKGILIDERYIAGTRVKNEKLINVVTSFEEDWIFYSAEGESSAAEDKMDKTSTKAFNLELLATGKIVTI